MSHVHMVSFCNLIGTARARRRKSTTFPADVTRLSPQKTGGGESLVTSVGKVVDFRRLALAVPIRLQNETMCTCDILSSPRFLRREPGDEARVRVGLGLV